MKNLVIKHFGHNVDVFSGQQGWTEHTRFSVIKSKHGKRLAFVTGKTLSPAEFHFVKDKVLK